MGQIEVNALLLQGFVFLGVLEDLHQGQQSGQAYFVVLRADAGFQILKRGLLPALLHHIAGSRHFNAKELIPLAILSLPRLEETRQVDGLLRILSGEDFIIKFTTHDFFFLMPNTHHLTNGIRRIIS